MAYENYIRKLQGKSIDSIDWKCPKCGSDMDFWSERIETYMMDGTLVVEDELVCTDDECRCVVRAEQVYTPGKLKIEIEEG